MRGREREEATPTAGTVGVHKNSVFSLLRQPHIKKSVLQHTPEQSFPVSFLSSEVYNLSTNTSTP